jgi:PadR family transcriptional regulator, regulatory protein AphA
VAELTPTSYLVLGMLAERGPSTPYELKQRVARSIGNFWPFPHTQLYTEPARLVRLGLLEEERETTGRRRRLFSVTERGRKEVARWLDEPVDDVIGYRDLGLLKLFFGAVAEPGTVAELAAVQVAVRESRMRMLEDKRRLLSDDPAHRYHLLTLELGIRYERAAIEFWREIAAHPPT